jgi:hypothetical protein
MHFISTPLEADLRCADDDVVGTTPDYLLALDLVFWDVLLHDVSDEVKAPIVFGLHHEDVVATQCVVM